MAKHQSSNLDNLDLQHLPCEKLRPSPHFTISGTKKLTSSHWCGETNKQHQFFHGNCFVKSPWNHICYGKQSQLWRWLISIKQSHPSLLTQACQTILTQPFLIHETTIFPREIHRFSMATRPPWRRGSGTRPPRSAGRPPGWGRWWRCRLWTAPGVAGHWEDWKFVEFFDGFFILGGSSHLSSTNPK